MKNQSISPVWKPDGSKLIYPSENTLIEIDTATGEKRQAVSPAELARFFDEKSPSVLRFTVAKNGDFVCLATAGHLLHTIQVSQEGAARVEPDDNPFALVPAKSESQTCSSSGNGATRIYFINNSGTTHPIEWISQTGTRIKYASLKPGETHVQSTQAGHVFSAGDLAFTATKQPAIAFLNSLPAPEKSEPSITPVKPPEQKWSAFSRNYNLFAKNNTTGQELQLTTTGTEKAYYTPPFKWSPDGRYLVATHVKAGTRRKIDLIQAAPRDRLQPKTETIPYLKPGDEVDLIKPHLFDLQAGKEIVLNDALFSNPFHIHPFHHRFQWSKNSDRFFFIYNERGHQTLRLLTVQASTGNVSTLIEEKSATFIDYNQKTDLHHLEKTDEVIWASERSGRNHLYLVNRKNGDIKPITSGNWVVRSVEKVDAENRQLWFRLAGYYPDQDPYYFHYARINFDGTGLVLLTEGNGTHRLNFSRDWTFYIDTWSRANLPPIYELRRSSNGGKVADLTRADASELLNIHPHLPEPFTAKGRDGKTDIYGVIYRPSHFDPKKKYPVIESIYASPHGFFVQKAFKAYHAQQGLAERGFIVVQIDGMGTNWRSREFHDVCWKNLKDAGFPDRIAWIKAAAKKYPSMDITRVGIHGGSAGGQSAMRAVLDHTGFYKAAVADCGCHDNRMDKIWWNEAWMGWPVDVSYEKSSNVADAHKLDGKLLLAVGMLDSNVDPSSTMQVVDALIKADKDFEIYVNPTGGHCVLNGPYGQRKLAEFFVQHLIEEPQ